MRRTTVFDPVPCLDIQNGRSDSSKRYGTTPVPADMLETSNSQFINTTMIRLPNKPRIKPELTEEE